jgi:alkaline phosphatase
VKEGFDKYLFNMRSRAILDILKPLSILKVILATFLIAHGTAAYGQATHAKYIILFIADGWGAPHIEATNQYCSNEGVCNSQPAYQDPDWDPGNASWQKEWISTYPINGSYYSSSYWPDPPFAGNFNYVLTWWAVTDSAAAARLPATSVLTMMTHLVFLQ